MLQHQAYAACGDDELVRARVRSRYAELVSSPARCPARSPQRLDDFMRHGMALNVAAALGVEELSVQCPWVQAELRGAAATRRRASISPRYAAQAPRAPASEPAKRSRRERARSAALVLLGVLSRCSPCSTWKGEVDWIVGSTRPR